MLSSRSKFGIVTSQFQRFRRILMDRFVQVNAGVTFDLQKRAFDPQRCLAKLRGLFQDYPGIYTHTSEFLYGRVQHYLTAFQQG